MKTKLMIGIATALLFATSLAAAKQQDLHAQAKISEATARVTALQKVPDGTVNSSELEREHGHLVWSFDISRPNSKDITEVLVDAKSGKIVTTQVESPADQARESKADAAAAKHQ